jgi:hypothetical protein
MSRVLLPVGAFLIFVACAREAPPAKPELPALPSWGKALPVDEGSRDPSFALFRDTLLAIAQRRDSAALAARLAPTIKFSFGDSQGGPPAFFAYWKKYESMDRMWRTLEDVLTHGGRFTDRESFYAPWTAGPLPDSLDAFEFLFVRDSNVIVHARPEPSDTGFGRLSFDIVRGSGDRSDSLWRGIKLPDGRVGYVEARYIRSPVEHRIGFRRSGTRWVIDFFVAGD